ncbi:hypothetical protein CDV36_011105 [Fusarium kuroshium]|uniref:Uncharacterized protein n=1 Tax=Fusarium kuroshium TaxID=2010991 RepID=A0A3M2RVV0_9HYPO|nr:hypothetical protein CDV36_011105 [Fusarium kuroshium]
MSVNVIGHPRPPSIIRHPCSLSKTNSPPDQLFRPPSPYIFFFLSPPLFLALSALSSHHTRQTRPDND